MELGRCNKKTRAVVSDIVQGISGIPFTFGAGGAFRDEFNLVTAVLFVLFFFLNFT